MTLAACSKDLKFYDWPGLTLSGLYETFEECMSIKSISWCNDGKSLVAIRNKDNPVIIKRPSNVAEKLETEIYLKHPVSSGAFANTSKASIAFGTSEGNLFIFDLKRKRKINEYQKLSSAINFLDFSFEDTLLAAGCSNGQLILYNSDPLPCASYAVPYSYSLSTLLFNKTIPNMLAAASKEGVVAIWNTEVGALLKHDKNHNSTVTDVAFFGNNLATVGTDGKFLIYDLKSNKEPISNYFLNTPLSGVDCIVENYDVAVSTSDGQLRSYDRRYMNTPINTVIAFNSGIKKIKFAPDIPRPESKDELIDHPSGDFNVMFKNSSHDGLKETKSFSNSYFNDVLPPSASEVALVNNNLSAEEMSEMLGIEELLRKNKQFFENKLLAEFYDLRIQISKQFIELQQRIDRSWDGFVNCLKFSGSQSTQSGRSDTLGTSFACAENRSVSGCSKRSKPKAK